MLAQIRLEARNFARAVQPMPGPFPEEMPRSERTLSELRKVPKRKKVV